MPYAGNLYTCSHDGCAYATGKKSHLTAHLMTHGAALTLACAACDKRFGSRANLTRHHRTHHAGVASARHSCRVCSYTASRSDALKV